MPLGKFGGTNVSYLSDFYNGKKVFVTGATGFKGSWLSEMLVRFGAKVTGYSLNPPTDPNLFSLLSLKDKINNVIGDVRDYEKLKKTFNLCSPDVVFHLAAQPIVLDSYKEPLYTYETNVLGTVNILECIRTYGKTISFVNITTDKVYENNDKPGHRFSENERLDGYDPYSNSKSCSELVTGAYKRSFFYDDNSSAISTARAGNVIGGGDFSPFRILPDAVRAAISGNDLVVRNKYSVRPYQFVLEPLFVYCLIAAKQSQSKQYSGSYNVGPDECDEISTGQLATLFCERWGNGMNWIDCSDKNKPHEASYLALDNHSLKQKFLWQPVMHVSEAVDWIVDWTKTYMSGGNIESLVDEQIDKFDKRFLQ